MDELIGTTGQLAEKNNNRPQMGEGHPSGQHQTTMNAAIETIPIVFLVAGDSGRSRLVASLGTEGLVGGLGDQGVHTARPSYRCRPEPKTTELRPSSVSGAPRPREILASGRRTSEWQHSGPTWPTRSRLLLPRPFLQPDDGSTPGRSSPVLRADAVSRSAPSRRVLTASATWSPGLTQSLGQRPHVTDRYIAEGLTPADARTRAREELRANPRGDWRPSVRKSRRL
jgi:hypothetical protein